MGGWLKLHRCIRNNPVVMKDADHLAIWVWLLTEASWGGGKEVMFGGERYKLKPGEFTTGRRKISEELRVSESKVQRVLKLFESEHQIEQRTDRQCRLISILNWDKYQDDEQRDEQQMNNVRTTSEQRLNTNKEYKNNKKDKKERIYIYTSETEEVIAYLNELTGSSYRATSQKTRTHLGARFAEGYTVDDCKTVVWKKVNEWKDDERMVKFLRPETLFGSKFESYLNQLEVTEKGRLDFLGEDW